MPWRIRGHNSQARTGSPRPFHLWLAEQQNLGRTPRFVVLEETTVEQSGPLERRWVSRLSRFKLLNAASAGSGNPDKRSAIWNPATDALLGTMSDARLAKKLGCTRKAVAYRRECLELPASFDRTDAVPPPNQGGWNKIEPDAQIVQLLGTMSDQKLADLAGVSKRTVARWRKDAGVPSYAEQTGDKGQFKKGQPHPRWS